MDALPLDAHGYPGSYKLVGGRPSLDLVNTVSWPGTDREHDWLATSANADAWLAAVGLVPGRGGTKPADMASVRAVVADVVRPLAHDETPPPRPLDRFNGLLAASLALRRIDPDGPSWTWVPPRTTTEALAPIVLDAAELVTGSHERLKYCPSCQWLFEDHSRNGRRRWCDMADCGSRAKAHAYYHRHK